MATLLFSAAGAALGAGFGGTFLGLSGAVIGRAIGATLGRAIDQRILGGGSDSVETARIDRLRLTGVSEGAPIPLVWGRMRVGGHLLWAAPFTETRHRRDVGGKGGGGGTVTEYSYATSLALGLCEGEILGIGRIWADGNEIDPASLSLRLYTGREDQTSDPRMEAEIGIGQVPAYRGLAYVVIEDLALEAYGNRVPQFSFEVMRPAQTEGGIDARPEAARLDQIVRGVALLPGTGEYALATTRVGMVHDLFKFQTLNGNASTSLSDLELSLEQLGRELPQARSVSLVVSWFGSDLRCGFCRLRPRVEQHDREADAMPWSVSGLVRALAPEVPRLEGRSIYGGTPTDQSVIEAIKAIRASGREVMFYPFILMEQLAGNSLRDPWSGEIGQPQMPWRGRITSEMAPGQPGSRDGTAAVRAEVAAFFGDAEPGHFTQLHPEDAPARDPEDDTPAEIRPGVRYTGPEDWRFRRFILHYANLCALAGGVDAFCIGSELVSLTRIRAEDGTFPAVEALCQLAGEVRAILGPDTRISYAADWTEYGAHAAGDDVYFPLDPLWAHPEIDFIGIDNYMPLSDWREGPDHADAPWGAATSLDYLMANIEGGEGHAWYYDSPEGEAAQIRRPIEDGLAGEHWIFRSKDLRGWWSSAHHPRIAGTRRDEATPWIPGAKPIRFTEYGCAAIDRGANQPNRFLDALSSESLLPRGSSGGRDDLMQLQYLRAVDQYWSLPGKNPLSPVTGLPMLDMEYAHVWAWDARPWPEFPGRLDLWSDGINHGRGHWLNGRATNQPLAEVIREICHHAGQDQLEFTLADGVVRGYAQDLGRGARAALQPLLLAHGVDAGDHGGKLRFRARLAGVEHQIAAEALAVTDELPGRPEHQRASAHETGSVVRLSHLEADGDYQTRMAEARHPGDPMRAVSASELAMALTAAEGAHIALRWLAEARAGRDSLRLALPPSLCDVVVGDRLQLEDASLWRVDRLEIGESRLIEATRIEPDPPRGDPTLSLPVPRPPRAEAGPVFPLFLDLPLARASDSPHVPHVAIGADPWPGLVSIWQAGPGGSFNLLTRVSRPAVIGQTETALEAAPPGLWDEGAPLRIRLSSGALASVSAGAVLDGANVLAIGDGSPGGWELMQFREAELVGPDTWAVTGRLRGQLGTDATMPATWPEGSLVTLIDASLTPLPISGELRGLERRYRIGATRAGQGAATVVERDLAFEGLGLRPWSPVHLRCLGQPGTDMTLSWIRRTRLEGDSWHAPEVPLAEESEAWLIRISEGGTTLAEHRTDAARFSWSLAQQAADGAGPDVTLGVAQISARFGPGAFRCVSFGTG